MQETVNNLWQTSGVAGIVIWESNSSLHLFTKRRLADWERQAITQVIAAKVGAYMQDPELPMFKVLGSYVYFHIETPFPPLAILTQIESIQLPDLSDLLLGIQQNPQQALAIFDKLAKNELARSSQKLSLLKSIAAPQQNVSEETIAIQELVDAFERLVGFCSKYIGQSMTLKYLEKNRPDEIWLSKFQVDKSLKIAFNGNISETVTPAQKGAIQQWIEGFIKESSSVFTYLPATLQKNALSERDRKIFFT